MNAVALGTRLPQTELGWFLLNELRASGKSQHGLAGDIGISQATLSNLIYGKFDKPQRLTSSRLGAHFGDRLPTVPGETPGMLKRAETPNESPRDEWDDLRRILWAEMLPDETVKAFYHRVGLHYKRVLRWLHGHRRPSAQGLVDLRRAFGDRLPCTRPAGSILKKVPRPTCSSCGRTSHSPPQSVRSYDPQTHTYKCTRCRTPIERIDVSCRICWRAKRMLQSRALYFKSYKSDGDIHTYICSTCSSRKNAKSAKAKLLSVHHGINPTDNHETKLEALRAHQERFLKNAPLLKPRTPERSEKERLRRSITILLKGQRSGVFLLCPLCHKLKYVGSDHAKRSDLGFHMDCYHVWRRGERYQSWLRESWSRPAGRERDLWKRGNPTPMPPAPRGRPPSSEQLYRHLRWLLRHVAKGESWREIATSDGFTHNAVRDGVLSLIELLPDRWELVFGEKGKGVWALNEAVPIDQIRLATKEARAKRR